MPTHDELVDIPVGEQHIAGTLVAPRTQIPGVLFVHGWGGSQQQYVARARTLAALGCVCLTFDLRGHAETHSQYETVSREDNLRDAVAAYDVLAAHRLVDATRMAVVGSSYGGYLAAILTSQRPVKWLSLRAPALYKDTDWELAKRHLKSRQDLDAYRRLPVRPEESRALRACTTFTGDVLIVESEHDLIVPHQVLVNYREACIAARSLTHRVIEDADHGLAEAPWQQAYTSLLVSWLSDMLFGAKISKQVAQVQTPPAETRPAEPELPENPGGPPAAA